MLAQNLAAHEIVASATLVFAWLLVLFSLRRYGYGLALVGLGATILHEVCHWLVGLLLNAKPCSISLWPKRHGRVWLLGSVTFARLNIWNAAFVAFAPLCMAPLAWYVFRTWMIPAYLTGATLEWTTFGYFVSCCVFGCVPSRADVKAGFLSASMYACGAIFLALFIS